MHVLGFTLQSQSQSYFTIGGLPPVSSFWWQAPWDSRSVIFLQLNSCGCNILSNERVCLSFTTAAGPRQRSHSQVRVPRKSWLYFTVWDPRLPEPVGPGSRIYIAQEQGGPVIPQALGSLFVASYDSQGYSGCIRPRPHTGFSSHCSIR
jgi:hypothetical protein